MLALSLVKRGLRLIDGLLSPFTLLLPGGLFPCPFALAVLLLPFVGRSGLPLRRLVGRSGGSLLRFAGFRFAGSCRRFVSVAQIGGQFGMLAE